MGLAAPRERTKLTQDLNNIKWTSSTTSFGHKILTSQGWSPGTFLGPRDAPHADHYTAANAAPIRITLKDDNLGLGAKLRRENEVTGLDAFQGLLGRLNGKSDEELAKLERIQAGHKCALYLQSRWATINFVRGGVLVSDDLQNLHTRKNDPEASSCENEGQDKTVVSEKQVKMCVAAPGSTEISRDKKEFKELKRKTAKKVEKKQRRLEKAAKKNRKEAKQQLGRINKAEYSSADTTERDSGTSNKEKRRLERAEKKKRKGERRLKKLRKRVEKEKEAARTVNSIIESDSSEEKRAGIDFTRKKLTSHIVDSGSRLSRESSTSSGMPRGIFAVRQRYIRQKNMASMDTKALQEVCETHKIS
ncbi:MAG: telomerase inhibitor [Cirrosporium novae-zelandiae]|nr:MAG: telomerase inhibitor [Cirrosporium novae-zelandiae]